MIFQRQDGKQVAVWPAKIASGQNEIPSLCAAEQLIGTLSRIEIEELK